MTSQIGPVNAGQPGVRKTDPAAWQATLPVRAASQRTLERVVPRRALRVLKRLLASVAVILSVVTVTFLVTRVFAPDPTNLFLGPSGNGFASAAAEAAEKAKVKASLGLNTRSPTSTSTSSTSSCTATSATRSRPGGR